MMISSMSYPGTNACGSKYVITVFDLMSSPVLRRISGALGEFKPQDKALWRGSPSMSRRHFANFVLGLTPVRGPSLRRAHRAQPARWAGRETLALRAERAWMEDPGRGKRRDTM